jgi:hypothetical protein
MSSAVKIAYASSSAVTITVASLATDANLLAGRQGALVDNTANLYLDYLLAGHFKAGTSPTASKSIEVHVVALADDTTWPDVFDGTDANKTITTTDIKNAVCKAAAVMTTDATTGRVYYFGPVSVANLFGGTLPKKFAVFCVHNTGVNLDSTGGNHAVTITGTYANVG